MSSGAGDRWAPPQPQRDPFASPTPPGPGWAPASGPAAGPGPAWPPAYGPPATPPRRRRVVVVLAVVVAALLTPVALGVVAAVVIPVVLNVRDQPAACGGETAPPGAAPDAVAYVDAVNRSAPARQALSDTIAANDHMVGDPERATALAIDDAFLADLTAIRFSPAAQPAAAEMVAAVEAYRVHLVRTLEVPMDPQTLRAESTAVGARREQAGAELRAALGLPRSGCSFHRP